MRVLEDNSKKCCHGNFNWWGWGDVETKRSGDCEKRRFERIVRGGHTVQLCRLPERCSLPVKGESLRDQY